jgi:hypothetical protein
VSYIIVRKPVVLIQPARIDVVYGVVAGVAVEVDAARVADGITAEPPSLAGDVVALAAQVEVVEVLVLAVLTAEAFVGTAVGDVRRSAVVGFVGCGGEQVAVETARRLTVLPRKSKA